MSPGPVLDSCPVPGHSSSIAGVAAPQSAHAAGGAAAAGDDADVPAGCTDAAGEGIANETGLSTVAGGCETGGSCSEGTEQGLGMMLSEYILQMHTTPVACNSVSGLGDDSDCEEDYEPAQRSSTHGLSTYGGQGSILASWGMMGPASAAAPQSMCVLAAAAAASSWLQPTA
ncbi:hypothetical protein OEZ86_006354 [Tetradesmus obliquus]|nr:hypothetical protein OEZ86_006354 [Tetradesmus obliquus]